MINASKVIGHVNYASPLERLTQFLRENEASNADGIESLTPDASTRVYFRIPWRGSTAVAAVYPESFDPEYNPFLDVSRLFREAYIPVPEIYSIEALAGIIVQEDLGDEQLVRLLPHIQPEERSAFLHEAMRIIAGIQAATALAYERDSIASRLAFDEAKLIWELEFFLQHYFGSLRREKLKRGELAELKIELNDVAAELSARPRVLCHRDFHTANLMIDPKRKVRVVDYQDARMGPASYDLVSLLLDRLTAPPADHEIAAAGEFFLAERRRLKLPAIEYDEFAREFSLMTVQRCLKAAGTFSNQTAVFKRGEFYARFINPTLLIVLAAAQRLDRFPLLRSMIEARAEDEIAIAN